jgi:DNA-directed RNA polymerase beta subunit
MTKEARLRGWVRELQTLAPAERSARLRPAVQALKAAAARAALPQRRALRDGQFAEVPDPEVDIEVEHPARFFGPHINLIPLQNAVAGPRLFYGARFFNQALPLDKPEAPLVQTLSDDPDGRSFDELMGDEAGNLRAAGPGVVRSVTPEALELETPEGPRQLSLYRNFSMNRKTRLHHTPKVKPGDAVQPGQLLARSNYTDDQGTLALGVNARVGLVPYLGRSMDDAVVISEKLAQRLASDQLYGHDLDYKRGVEGGKSRHMGLFPNKFTRKQLDLLDDDGVVKPGQILQPGDPFVLATAPRVISSASAQLGQLSKHMRNARTDASLLWDHETPGEVVDVAKLKHGVKVNIRTVQPARVGDKISLRAGQKAIISHILPDEQVPRTADGQPLEMLLNPLGIPSRVNNSLVYELLLGKAAQKAGQPYKLPGFNGPQEKWYDFVKGELTKHGLSDTEEVFDPQLGVRLENPITVGIGHVLKLTHQAEGKISARGQGAYSADQIPLHGSGAQAQSKRLSGLESNALLSAGAYGVLREGATLRGTRNDEYWRTLRMGQTPQNPGQPFVWDKFKALLIGAGYHARKLGGGKERLTFFTDKDLDKTQPLEVKTGDLVDLSTLEPVKGGLFDAALTGGNKWGFIGLPFKVPNPAAEDVVRRLLGLTEAQYRAVLAGEMELKS